MTSSDIDTYSEKNLYLARLICSTFGHIHHFSSSSTTLSAPPSSFFPHLKTLPPVQEVQTTYYCYCCQTLFLSSFVRFFFLYLSSSFICLIPHRVPFLPTLQTTLDCHYQAFSSYSKSYSRGDWDESLLTQENKISYFLLPALRVYNHRRLFTQEKIS